MKKQFEKKFVWVIKDFSPSLRKDLCSEQFAVGSCRWCLFANTTNNGYLSLSLRILDFSSMNSGWKRRVKLRVRVVNHISEKLSGWTDSELWFDEKAPLPEFLVKLELSKYHSKESGFVLNGNLTIVAEIDALEVNGLKNSNDFLPDKIQQLSEIKDVNEFPFAPSQVEIVKHIFERHPNIASEVRPRSQHLRTMYMKVLLGLIETLCQPTQELSDDDLSEASDALSYVAKAGYKLDWLEKKLSEVCEKKNKMNTVEARLPKMEEELLILNKKCSDLNALLEKEKAEVTAAKIHLSFDDVV